jgi:hypothetical protein
MPMLKPVLLISPQEMKTNVNERVYREIFSKPSYISSTEIVEKLEENNIQFSTKTGEIDGEAAIAFTIDDKQIFALKLI